MRELGAAPSLSSIAQFVTVLEKFRGTDDFVWVYVIGSEGPFMGRVRAIGDRVLTLAGEPNSDGGRAVMTVALDAIVAVEYQEEAEDDSTDGARDDAAVEPDRDPRLVPNVQGLPADWGLAGTHPLSGMLPG